MHKSDRQWRATVSAALKAQLKLRQVSYDQLAAKLQALGVYETDKGVANKLSKGGFSAVYFVQCLLALGVESFRLGDLDLS